MRKSRAFLTILLSLVMLATPLTAESQLSQFAGVIVDSNQSKVDIIEAYLQNQAPGLSITYRDVFNAIIAEGHNAYIIGGAVRDLLSGRDIEPRDVDFAYTCTKEELKAILMKYRIMFIAIPNRKVIQIGGMEGPGMDAMPMISEQFENMNLTEFSLNSIYYDCKNRILLTASGIDFQDVEYGRLRILSDDWNKWMSDNKKIIRFWKMVGRGFLYTVEMEQFVREKTLELMRSEGDVFLEIVIQDLGEHYERYEEIARGCELVMGYDWCNKNIRSAEPQIQKVNHNLGQMRQRYTYFPSNQEYQSHPALSFLGKLFCVSPL